MSVCCTASAFPCRLRIPSHASVFLISTSRLGQLVRAQHAADAHSRAWTAATEEIGDHGIQDLCGVGRGRRRQCAATVPEAGIDGCGRFGVAGGRRRGGARAARLRRGGGGRRLRRRHRRARTRPPWREGAAARGAQSSRRAHLPCELRRAQGGTGRHLDPLHPAPRVGRGHALRHGDRRNARRRPSRPCAVDVRGKGAGDPGDGELGAARGRAQALPCRGGRGLRTTVHGGPVGRRAQARSPVHRRPHGGNRDESGAARPHERDDGHQLSRPDRERRLHRDAALVVAGRWRCGAAALQLRALQAQGRDLDADRAHGRGRRLRRAPVDRGGGAESGRRRREPGDGGGRTHLRPLRGRGGAGEHDRPDRVLAAAAARQDRDGEGAPRGQGGTSSI